MAKKQLSEKEEARILSGYLKDKLILIAHGETNTRADIRIVLKEMGVDTKQMLICVDVKTAVQTLEKNSPHIMIIESKIRGESCVPLQHKHLQLCPNRAETISIALGHKPPSTDYFHSLLYYQDAVLDKPYFRGKFIEVFKELVIKKATQSQNLKMSLKALAPFFKGQLEGVPEIIAKLQEKNISNEWTSYAEGTILHIEKNYKESEKRFREGLSSNMHSFYCLKGLYEVLRDQKKFAEAYLVVDRLIKDYTFDPRTLPEMSKVYVINEKYDDIIKFCDEYTSYEKIDEMFGLNDEEGEPEALQNEILTFRTKVSICLLACAKLFSQKGEKDKAQEVYQRSFYLAPEERVNIRGQIIHELINMGRRPLASKLLAEVNPELFDDNLSIASLILNEAQLAAGAVLNEGIKLLQKGIKDSRVFDIVIRKSVELQRRGSAIKELVEDAVKAHPQMKKYFERYLDSNEEEVKEKAA